MDRGLYAAASGGLLESRHLDVVANNLANSSTVGFKAERLVSKQQTFSDTLASKMVGVPNRAVSDIEQTPGVVDVHSITDFSLGPISHTDNPLHVALRQQNHFFVVQTPTGEAYTRAGNFTVDATGTLVTTDGMPVLGEGGAITFPSGEVQISGSGAVLANNEVVGQMRVVHIDALEQLRRTEGVRFQLEGGASVTNVPADLVPRSVEMPNISIVEAMVEMINAQKSFEAYTKTVRVIDELNEESIRNARPPTG
jgi:flagellar basal-body rod protein FlgF